MKFFSRWFIVRNKWPQFLHQVRRSYVLLFRHIRYIVSLDFSIPNAMSSFFLRVYFSRVKSWIHPLYFFNPSNDRTCSLYALQSISTSLLYVRFFAHNHFHAIKRSCRAKVKRLRVPFLKSNFDISRFFHFSFFTFDLSSSPLFLSFLPKISRHLALSRHHFPFVYRFYPRFYPMGKKIRILIFSA